MNPRTTLGPALLAALILTACASDDVVPGADEPCAPGTRVCDGQTVLLCSAAVEMFVLERECPTGTTCAAGECRPEFVGGGGTTDGGATQDGAGGARGADGGPGEGVLDDAVAPTADAAIGDGAGGGTSNDTSDAGATDGGTGEGSDGGADTAVVPDVVTVDAGPPDVTPMEDTQGPDAGLADAGSPWLDATTTDAPTQEDTQGEADVAVDAGAPDVAPPDPCGNGFVDPGELCDPGILVGDGACPQACSDPPGCAILLLDGDAETCDAVCTKVLVSEPIPGDDCCPAGATAATDPDCGGTCGNGKKEADEQCDGTDLGGATCGFSGVLPSCLKDCTLSTLPCPGKHTLLYEKVKNLLPSGKGDLHTVRWHPSGAFALILGGGGDVLRYDADTKELSAVTNLYAPLDIDVHPSGAWFLIVGTDKSKAGHVWRVTVAEDLSLTVTDDTPITNGTPVAISWADWEETFVIGSRGDNYINWLYLWRDGETPKLKGYNDNGIVDLMVGRPAKYYGEPTVLTSDGVNGSGSTAYILTIEDFDASGWPASFGNPGTAAWRPGGTYGMFTAWTAGKLYVFDGSSWSNVALPNTPSGAGPNGIGWKPDGTRALVVGNAIGTSLRAVVVDYRPAGKIAFDASDFVDQSINGWSLPAWGLGTDASSADLLDVDWRPGACDEGLIVASDPAPSWSPTYGVVVRFWDQDDPDCEP